MVYVALNSQAIVPPGLHQPPFKMNIFWEEPISSHANLGGICTRVSNLTFAQDIVSCRDQHRPERSCQAPLQKDQVIRNPMERTELHPRSHRSTVSQNHGKKMDAIFCNAQQSLQAPASSSLLTLTHGSLMQLEGLRKPTVCQIRTQRLQSLRTKGQK